MECRDSPDKSRKKQLFINGGYIYDSASQKIIAPIEKQRIFYLFLDDTNSKHKPTYSDLIKFFDEVIEPECRYEILI